ncbi:MAG TPA: hypothetical protein VK059_12780 [Nocardioidaceae bacterium]|nr:hypothetical protein [Nocardioidaceae bacterium]
MSLQTATDDRLIRDQDGVLRAAQADALFGREIVRHKVRSGRWRRPCRGVVVMHNGDLSGRQRAWVALFSATPRAALGGRSALEFDGFEGFAEKSITVVLPAGATRPAYADVEPRFSTMLDERDVHPLHRPRRTRVARSLVDFASWQDAERRARAIVLSGVQQRITSTRHLREALTRRGPCRHRALIIESILDAAGGVQSLPERDFDQIRTRRGLPVPDRQAIVRRADGSYYLDAAWAAYDTGCEIHGVPHMLVPQWDVDLLRANEVNIIGPRMLAFSSYAIRHEQEVVADQLERALRRGGWTG